MQVRTQQHDTVDLLCHRHLGSTAQGLVERTYALNPGLAERGPLLPAGLLVTLATQADTAATPSHTIHLWD